jgi:hypothetical protein
MSKRKKLENNSEQFYFKFIINFIHFEFLYFIVSRFDFEIFQEMIVKAIFEAQNLIPGYFCGRSVLFLKKLLK